MTLEDRLSLNIDRVAQGGLLSSSEKPLLCHGADHLATEEN